MSVFNDPLQTNTAAAIRDFAIGELGFDACGFTAPAHAANAEKMEAWLAQGFAGDMDYLARHAPLKAEPEQLLPGVKTAIVLLKNYKNTSERALSGPFKMARYAVGEDYHHVIRRRLHDLETHLRELAPGAEFYAGVDSRPLDERGLALQAGLGFRGRNTMLIRPGLGSYTFLAVVLTTLELPPDAPIRTNCGTCRRCVDACPTNALLEDGQLDARRCISYLNIEQKQPMPPERLGELNDWIFGCDICQEVCPFNRDDVRLSDWPAFRPESGVGFAHFRNHASEEAPRIPKRTALHRSRKQVRANFEQMRAQVRVAAEGGPEVLPTG